VAAVGPTQQLQIVVMLTTDENESGKSIRLGPLKSWPSQPLASTSRNAGLEE
jgi:hypothetical protein